MTSLKMLSSDEKLTEIRSLYFNTTKQSIQQDIAKALDLLKSMPSEDDRERATVFMEGLAEMQRDWTREPKARSGKKNPAAAKGARPNSRANAGKGARPAGKGGAPKAGAARDGRAPKTSAGSGPGGRKKS